MVILMTNNFETPAYTSRDMSYTGYMSNTAGLETAVLLDTFWRNKTSHDAPGARSLGTEASFTRIAPASTLFFRGKVSVEFKWDEIKRTEFGSRLTFPKRWEEVGIG